MEEEFVNKAAEAQQAPGTEEQQQQEQQQEQQPAAAAVATENPPNVKQSIDTDLLQQLRDEMGFNQLRAEKALYYTKNCGLEAAIQWIEDHEQDEDIDAPVVAGSSSSSNLTKEEAERKAFELQQQVRKHRAEQEKIDALEKERKRIEMGKSVLDTQRAIEEAAKKQMIEQIKREKAQHEAEKQRQLELLKRDYEDRFGKPYPEEERKKEETDISKKSAKDQCAYWIGRLKLRGTKETNKEALLGCVKTLDAYIRKAHDNPAEPKYHRIKKDNKIFASKVLPFAPEALELLNVVGFHDNNEGALVIDGLPDKYLMSRALDFLNLIIAQFS